MTLAGTGVVGIAHLEGEGEIVVFVEDDGVKERIPGSVQGYPVTVEVTGKIEALGAPVVDAVVLIGQDRQGEIRPLVGGTSLSALMG